ncbi:MAG: outer membrane protein assembly factor BamE [Verrucomicrobiae bacterium]|nr:outer membrane protein assembly factor BamE [Verrucomicrobiae bacterium]
MPTPILPLSLTLLLSLIPSACTSNRLTNENLSQLTPGMSEKQITQILGKPHHTEISETLGIRSTALIYQAGVRQVKIILINDKLFSKQGTF